MNFDITSPQNPRIKHAVKLREDKRQRQRDRLMLVEGFDELTLAAAAGMQAQTLFIAPELGGRQIDGLAAETVTVNRVVFEKLSYRENPDGCLGLFPIPEKSLQDLKPGTPSLVIAAESIEKPGNLGAILRSADAAGVDALLVCDPRVDLWNPNVVRASRGTLFTTPAVETDNIAALAWMRRHGMQILAATPSADVLYTDADLTRPVAVLVGTEDAGLSPFWMTEADLKVRIPMRGKVNSLNVSIATALILFEAVRQRAGRARP
jgi:TrmH family RNA methyltransferase